MTKIKLKKVKTELRSTDTPLIDHCSKIIAKPCVGVDEKTGEPIFILSKTPEALSEPLFGALRNMSIWNQTKRSNGIENTSRIYGFRPRQPAKKFDWCQKATLERDYPWTTDLLKSWVDWSEAEYRKHNLKSFLQFREKITNTVKPCWRFGEIYTSGIINRSNALAYHKDARNFGGVWSAMIVLKTRVRGGLLSIPEYDVLVDIPHGCTFFFDGQGLLHGVTGIEKENPLGIRFSVVAYSLEQMCKCLEPEQEIERAKKVFTERFKKQREYVSQPNFYSNKK